MDVLACVLALFGFIYAVYRFFTADDRIVNRKPLSELKKESEPSQFKLELQNTASFICNNNNEIICGLYESEYKPLVLEHLRKAAAEGQFDQNIRIYNFIAEHIEDNKLKISENNMVDKIYKMFEEDPVFKGFHISSYRSTDNRVGLYFSWR